MTALLTFLTLAMKKRAVRWGLAIALGALPATCLLALSFWNSQGDLITAIRGLPYDERYSLDVEVLAGSRRDRAQVERKRQQVTAAIEAIVDAPVPSPKDEFYFVEHHAELESKAKFAVEGIISNKVEVDVEMSLQRTRPQARSKQ